MVKPSTSRPAETSESKYKGVRKRKWGKYVSEIRLPNSRERIWLGSYDTAEKAARAFDAALFCLRGRTANFNFPENPPEIVGGRTLSPAEIQAAAARYANSEAEQQVGRSDRSDNSSSSSSTQSHSQVEAPSPSQSVSDGAVQRDSETTLENSFSDLFSSTWSSDNGVADFGIYPGFDDLSNDFFPAPLPNFDDGEDNYNGDSSQESFLWNF